MPADGGPTDEELRPQTIRWSELPGEPFRLFFPLGLLAGVFAVILWPLFLYGLWPLFPGPTHGRMMIMSFFGAFVVGFLGTAAPRILEVRPLGWPETAALLGVYLAGSVAYAGGWLAFGDGAFLVFFAGFATMLARRFPRRSDLPPPSFALVVCGFAHFPVGLLFLLGGSGWGAGIPWSRLGMGFVAEGALLCMIAGVGAFFFPRLLGYPPRQRFPGGPTPDAEWVRGAMAPFLIGALVFASFWIEYMTHEATGIALRYVSVSAYLLRMVPLWKKPEQPGFLTFSLKVALASVPLGGIAMILFPAFRTAGLHAVLLTGIGLITWIVATRVIFGHAGLGARLKGPVKFLGIVLALSVASLVLRFLADVHPEAYAFYLGKAAFLWVAAAAVWAFHTVPLAFRPDTDP